MRKLKAKNIQTTQIAQGAIYCHSKNKLVILTLTRICFSATQLHPTLILMTFHPQLAMVTFPAMIPWTRNSLLE
jgi:hypothetical protein